MKIPKTGDWSSLLDGGENPNGFISQTPNGTMRNGRGSDGEQFNFFPQADGPRWSPKGPDIFAIGVGARLPTSARGVSNKN